MDSTKIVHVLTLAIIFIIIHNSKTNPCLDQIITIGGMNIDIDSKEAFTHVYLKMNVNVIFTPANDILYTYLKYLIHVIYKLVVHNGIELKNPMNWCQHNITKYYILDKKVKQGIKCVEIFKNTGFKLRGKSWKAVEYGFYNLVDSMDMEEAIRGYYMYILETILEKFDKSQAIGPKQYCENYTVSYCLDQITNTGLNKNSDGMEAFQFAYFTFNLDITNSPSKNILRQYLKYLFDTAIIFYRDNMLHNPQKWCLINLAKYYIIPEEDRRKMICGGFFKNAGFVDNARVALEHAYYNLSIRDDINNLLKDYYLYMMRKFSKIVGKSEVKGPLEYCKSLNLSFESSLTSRQRKTVDSAQYFPGQHQQDNLNAVDQFSQNNPNEIYNLSLVNTSAEINTIATTHNISNQPQLGLDQNWGFHPSSGSAYAAGYSGAAKDDLYYDPSKTDLDIETSNTFADDQITIIHPTFYVNPTDYSGAQGSNQNWEFYRSSESTSAGDHTPNIANQFSSAAYNPDLFFDDYEASFSPSLFISSPNENNLNNPYFKPSG